MVFDSTNKNKKVLKKYTEHWDGIKNEIETINGGKKGEYVEDFMKIKFNKEDSKFYLQLYLDECLYEL